mmetsp:Transcript_58788/g.110151  ORF Transcript_58788/g.110151 Transcript_58788/m.110151 type:complete len:360 (+) Transcript_58788:25-1104(+)
MGQTACCKGHEAELPEAVAELGKDEQYCTIELNKDEPSHNAPLEPQDDDALIEHAIEAAQRCLAEFDLDHADDILGAALSQIDEASAKRLRQSETFRQVQRHLGQYELAKEMLFSDGFEVLWQQDNATMEVKRDPTCRVFEYRLVIELDQPLSKAMAHMEEVDLIHKVQKQLCQPVQSFGTPTAWQKVYMMCFNVAILRVEVLHEVFRYRGRKDGFLMEGIRTEFDQSPYDVPTKSWRAFRPWTVAANLWKPSEDGTNKTTFIHVTRAEAGMTLASWMLDTAAYFVARSFAADVQKAAAETSKPGSPWMERMRADKDGFYRELQHIEKARQRVPWDDRFLHRKWKLQPETQNAIPPSLR